MWSIHDTSPINAIALLGLTLINSDIQIQSTLHMFPKIKLESDTHIYKYLKFFSCSKDIIYPYDFLSFRG